LERSLRFAVEVRRAPHESARHARRRLGRFGGECVQERFELAVPLGAFFDEAEVDEAVLDEDVRERVEQEDVRSGPELEVYVGDLGELGPSRVDDHELRAVQNARTDARAPMIGCASVAFDPATRIASARSMSESEFVAAPVPNDQRIPAAVGAWQTRAQQSTSFVPSPARSHFWKR
jgi:hypothetical protein